MLTDASVSRQAAPSALISATSGPLWDAEASPSVSRPCVPSCPIADSPVCADAPSAGFVRNAARKTAILWNVRRRWGCALITASLAANLMCWEVLVSTGLWVQVYTLACVSESSRNRNKLSHLPAMNSTALAKLGASRVGSASSTVRAVDCASGELCPFGSRMHRKILVVVECCISSVLKMRRTN